MIHPSTVSPSDEVISPDEVAPGIFRLKIPVPFRGLRYVNLWLLRDRDGFTMIDCGWSDDTTHSLLHRHWDAILGDLPITRLIITHFHPDHAGNCRFICERWGLRPIMPQLEWMAANVAMRSMYSDDFDLKANYFEQNGVSPELLVRYRAENMQYAAGAALTESFERIRAGDRLRIGERDWQILLGLGHSPEMALLYNADDDILISADQILPKITPNVSVWPWEPLADPLTEFLSTLADIDLVVSEQTHVLPSHREPFFDARARIAELRQHHTDRLTHLTNILAQRGASTAGSMLEDLFEVELDGHQLNFAMGEAIAHLNYLCSRGEVERHVDGRGLLTFSLGK
ncbi:MAG: MBL fold metallo-hydrolase [Hyphomicrobiaceae bacterium]